MSLGTCLCFIRSEGSRAEAWTWESESHPRDLADILSMGQNVREESGEWAPGERMAVRIGATQESPVLEGRWLILNQFCSRLSENGRELWKPRGCRYSGRAGSVAHRRWVSA